MRSAYIFYLSLTLVHLKTTGSVSTFSDIIGKMHNMNLTYNTNLIKGSTKLISNLLGDPYASANIRGGNSKFKYIPPRNYREVSIYQLPNFDGTLKNKDNLTSLLMSHKNSPVSRIFQALFQQISTTELSAMEKGIFTVCKWAISIPSYSLDKSRHCTNAELKSILPD